MDTLTPKEDKAIRDFYTRVLSREDLFPSDPVNRLQAIALCRRLLGYVVVDGKHISKEVAATLTHKLGETVECEDEWDADAKRNMAALYELEVKDEKAKNKSTRARKTNRSKSAKSTKVRKALLPEDV